MVGNIRVDTEECECLAKTGQSREVSANSYPNNPSCSPAGDVAGGGRLTAGDLWTTGPDWWSALWGPGARAPLVGKRRGGGGGAPRGRG